MPIRFIGRAIFILGWREREREVGVDWSPLLLRALRVHLFVTLAEYAVTVIWQAKAASTGLEQRRLFRIATVHPPLFPVEPWA